MPADREAKVAAKKFRQQHNLGNQPLGDLAELIQRTTGHDVAVLDVPSSDIGLTMYDPAREKYIIGVPCTPYPMRQRSILAQELAYIILWDLSSDLSQSHKEFFADAFAQHLLVPHTGLEEILGEKDQTISLQLLSRVVRHFLVPPQMAANALRDAWVYTAKDS